MLSPKTNKTRLSRLFCDILDFPPAAINAPSVEIVGREHLTALGCYTIGEYSSELIAISSASLTIQIKGSCLSIASCKNSRIDVGGVITSITFTDDKENL